MFCQVNNHCPHEEMMLSSSNRNEDGNKMASVVQALKVLPNPHRLSRRFFNSITTVLIKSEKGFDTEPPFSQEWRTMKEPARKPTILCWLFHENHQFFNSDFFFLFSFPKTRSCMSLVLKFQKYKTQKLLTNSNTCTTLKPPPTIPPPYIQIIMSNASNKLMEIETWKALESWGLYLNAQGPWCQVTTLFAKCIKYVYIYILERTFFQVPFGLKESLKCCASGLKDNYSILSWVRRIRLPLMDIMGLNFKPCIRYTYHSFWLPSSFWLPVWANVHLSF